MNRDIFASSILIVSAILQNASTLALGDKDCSKNLSFVSMSAGYVISRLGDSQDINSIHGIRTSIGLSRSSYSGFAITGTFDASYSQSDIFGDSKRTSLKYQGEGEVVDFFGIKNTNMKIELRLCRGFSREKENLLNHQSVKAGISMRAKFDNAKSKKQVDLVNYGKFLSSTTIQYMSALMKFDSYSVGVGICGDAYYKSNRFLVLLLADIGVDFYNNSEYVFGEKLAGKPQLEINIKTKSEALVYIDTKYCMSYFVYPGVCIGCEIILESDFMGDTKLRKDATSNSSDILDNSSGAGENTAFPVKQGDNLRNSLSKGMRASLSLIAIFSEK